MSTLRNPRPLEHPVQAQAPRPKKTSHIDNIILALPDWDFIKYIFLRNIAIAFIRIFSIAWLVFLAWLFLKIVF